MNISHSLINAFDGLYIDQTCGLFFEACYIKKEVETIPSEAMKLGQYFEYICTGATLRDGSIPQAQTTKKGELTADYARAHIQKEYWDVFAEHFQLKNIVTGFELKIMHGNHSIKGIADVMCSTADEEVAFIDLKYTGQIDNKWDSFGWGHMDLGGDKKKMNQAVLYCWAYEELTGIRPAFYFYVASSKCNKRRIIKVKVTDAAIEDLKHTIDYVAEMIDYNNANGWTPTQNYLNCIDCPLAEKCDHVIKLPLIQHITV